MRATTDDEFIYINSITYEERHTLKEVLGAKQDGIKYSLRKTRPVILVLEGTCTVEGDEGYNKFRDSVLNVPEEALEVLNPILENTNIPLMRHQKIFLYQARHHHRVYNASEQGTGKTFMTLAWLLTQTDIYHQRTLIVCPKSLIPQWASVIRQYYKRSPRIWCKGDKDPIPDKGFVIVNYENITTLEKSLLHCHCVVVDESWKVKNRKAKCTKSLTNIVKSNFVASVICLSGTPIGNSMEDIYSQFYILGYRRNYFSFVGEYCHVKELQLRDRRIIQVTGARNVPNLLQEIHPDIFWFRATKQQLDLPPKLTTVINLPADEKFRRIYNSIGKRDPLDYLTNVATQNLRKHQFTGGFLNSEFHETPKFKWLMEYVTDLMADGQKPNIIIWCRYIKEIAKINEELNSRRLGCSYPISGATKPTELQKVLEDYKNPDKTLKVLVCQIAKMCAGHNLQETNYNVYFSPSWSYIELAQSEDRSHRIGREGAVTNVFPLTEGTVDEDLYATLLRKEDYSESLSSGTLE